MNLLVRKWAKSNNGLERILTMTCSFLKHSVRHKKAKYKHPKLFYFPEIIFANLFEQFLTLFIQICLINKSCVSRLSDFHLQSYVKSINFPLND